MNMPIPSEKGAIEEIIWQTAKRLKRKYDVQIYNPLANSIIKKIINGISLKNSGIIHSHNFYTSIGLFIRRFNHLLTIHYPPWISNSGMKRRIRIATLNIFNRKGITLISPSIYIAKWLIKNGFNRVKYIPNGVDTEIFSYNKRNEELREKLLDGKEILIVSLGRICKEKNQLILLRTIKHIVEKHKNIKLILLGPTAGFFGKLKGDYTYYLLLKQYVEKHNLKQYVQFLGDIPLKRDVARILASSDIYVHPSKVEAAPLAILEAMASGLPILAFNLPFYSGYLFDNINALLVPLDDLNKFKEYLLILIEDEHFRKKLSLNAIKFTNEKFSWDVIVEKHYLKLYNTLM